MFRFRVLLVWLLMAAVPLQGWAAASMLFCGSAGQHSTTQAVEAGHGASDASEGASNVGHDHSAHDHAQVQKPSGSTGQSTDVGHKCAACAACCHGVAMTAFPEVIAFGPLPQSELSEPFVVIDARPSPVPDKPPRA